MLKMTDHKESNSTIEIKDEKTKSKMNKTWILIAVLVIITGILLILSLTAKKPISSPTPISENKNQTAQSLLYFSNELRESSTSATYEVDILINSNENEITQAQLELSFDPNVLTKVDIKPGSFIRSPVIIQKNINTTDGRIKYWIGVNPNEKGIQGKGAIATMVFSKNGSTAAQVNFLPKTSISGVNTNQSVLKNATSGYFNILPTKKPTPTITRIPRVSVSP